MTTNSAAFNTKVSRSHWGNAKGLEGLTPSLEVLRKTVFLALYSFGGLSLPLQSQEGNTSLTWLPSCTFEDPVIALDLPVSQADLCILRRAHYQA